jgi:ribosome recycling factor
MEEEVQLCLEDAKEKMDSAIDHLETALSKVRAGKANPNMVDEVQVDYYGTPTPLSRVSNVSTPDPRTLRIQPWEKNMIEPIEKAIMAANLGFNPSNNGEAVIISVPMLTEERRMELVKQSKNEGESSKVSIRNARRDANDYLKKLIKDGLSEDNEKDAEAEVQKMTDDFIKKIDELVDLKEKNIMTI